MSSPAASDTIDVDLDNKIESLIEKDSIGNMIDLFGEDLEHQGSEALNTPPPISSPPPDADYSQEFLAVVSEAVKKAKELALVQYTNEICLLRPSYESDPILDMEDQNSQQIKRVYNEESEVEQPRRKNITLDNDIDTMAYRTLARPFHSESAGNKLEESDSQQSIPEFYILKDNAQNTNDLRYRSSKAKSSRSRLSDVLKSIDSQFFLDEYQDILGFDEENVTPEARPESSSQDFSSWLCFSNDEENEYASFKQAIMADDCVPEKRSASTPVATKDSPLPNRTEHNLNSSLPLADVSLYQLPPHQPARSLSVPEQDIFESKPISPCPNYCLIDAAAEKKVSWKENNSSRLRSSNSSSSRPMEKVTREEQDADDHSISLGSFKDNIVNTSTPPEKKSPMLSVYTKLFADENDDEEQQAAIEQRRSKYFDKPRRPDTSSSQSKLPFFSLRRRQ